MIELTAEQRLELNEAIPRVVDPETQITYVLVKEDLYKRLEELLVPDRLTDFEQQAVLHAAGLRAGWGDPEMDAYDREESSPPRPPRG